MTVRYLNRRSHTLPSPVFVGILVLTLVTGGYLWQADRMDRPNRMIAFVFLLLAWVVTLCLHEFAHAFLAWRFGDRDVAARGYLTLDPLKYTHPVLSIVLPLVFIALGGIGLPGGAVYLHTDRFRSRLRRALVSLAGPGVNLVAAVVMLAAFRAWASSAHAVFWLTIAFLAFLQLTAAVLNLLPIPGLDGYGAVESYLKPETRRSMEFVKQYGMLIVFALLTVPQLNAAFFDLIYRLYEVSGVNRAYPETGNAFVRFWRQ